MYPNIYDGTEYQPDEWWRRSQDDPQPTPEQAPISMGPPDPNSEGNNGGLYVPPPPPPRNKYGTTANLDRTFLREQIRADAAKQGITLTPEREEYWIGKASKPDEYSDGQWRVGWNPYWASRLNGRGSSDPSLAGSADILEGYAGGGSSGSSAAPVVAPFSPSGSGFPKFNPPSPLQLPDPFSYPDYVPPDPFAYDAYTLAQPFSYEAFQAPTGASIYSDPSYQFRLEQGAKALEASAANRGTLRTGGHLKNLEGYAQNFASQEYGNIYNRAAQQYGLNRTNAKDIYTTNEGNRASTYNTNLTNAKDIYGINAAGGLGAYNTNLANAKDAYTSKADTARGLYDSTYKTAQDKFDAEQKTAELQFGREWDAYKYANDEKYRYWNAQLGADTQRYGDDVRNLY